MVSEATRHRMNRALMVCAPEAGDLPPKKHRSRLTPAPGPHLSQEDVRELAVRVEGVLEEIVKTLEAPPGPEPEPQLEEPLRREHASGWEFYPARALEKPQDPLHLFPARRVRPRHEQTQAYPFAPPRSALGPCPGRMP